MSDSIKQDRLAEHSRTLSLGLIGVVVLSLVVALGCAFTILAQGRHYPAYAQLALEQQMLAQQIHVDNLSMLAGETQASQRVGNGMARFDSNMQTLAKGAAGIPAAPAAFAANIASLDEDWATAKADYSALVSRAEQEQGMQSKVQRLDFQLEQSQSVLDSHLRKVLAEDWERPAARAALARLTQAIAQLRLKLLAFSDKGVSVADLRASIDSELNAMLAKGTSGGVVLSRRGVREGLATVRDALSKISPAIDEVAVYVQAEKRAESVLADHRTALLSDGQALSEQISIEQKKLDTLQTIAIVAGLLMLLALLLLAGLVWRSSNMQMLANVSQSQKNHRAIMRLLDEMTDLADGDLRVEATVNEDITGAIADAVNYAVESLRDLVQTIGQSAKQVRFAVRHTDSNAKALVEASAVQAREISDASTALDKTAAHMRNSAIKADGAVEVALNSVDTAARGAEAVQQMAQGMGNIREQIQETGKRLKRLGESSQEINDINALIEEIAGRTTVLSLNASLKAGDGHQEGFAQVSDEIQRLAERVGDATRRVEEIVNNIQVDTMEAMASMERSTAGVVRGASLAENAGSALSEIETVSHKLAGLISEISEHCNQQARVASSVSKTMNVIRNISQQTAEGTRNTASAVGKLGDLSEKLNHSIAGFRMPDSASDEVADAMSHEANQAAPRRAGQPVA